jgi:hypothetical protein
MQAIASLDDFRYIPRHFRTNGSCRNLCRKNFCTFLPVISPKMVANGISATVTDRGWVASHLTTPATKRIL